MRSRSFATPSSVIPSGMRHESGTPSVVATCSGAMTLASLLLDHPFADDEDLLHTIDRSETAGTARSAAREVAERLGPLDGRAVAVQLPNGPELVWTMVGVWLAGGVYVPVNPRNPATEVDAVLSMTEPAFV